MHRVQCHTQTHMNHQRVLNVKWDKHREKATTQNEMWRNHNSSIILVEAITMHLLSLCAPQPFIDHWHSTGNVSFIFKTMTSHILQPDLVLCMCVFVRQLNPLKWHALKLCITPFYLSLSDSCGSFYLLRFSTRICSIHLSIFIGSQHIIPSCYRMHLKWYALSFCRHDADKYILIPFDCRFRSIPIAFLFGFNIVQPPWKCFWWAWAMSITHRANRQKHISSSQ